MFVFDYGAYLSTKILKQKQVPVDCTNVVSVLAVPTTQLLVPKSITLLSRLLVSDTHYSLLYVCVKIVIVNIHPLGLSLVSLMFFLCCTFANLAQFFQN